MCAESALVVREEKRRAVPGLAWRLPGNPEKKKGLEEVITASRARRRW
jgi:hypothetical protein